MLFPIIATFTVLVVVNYVQQRRNARRYPPGPPIYPLLGNIVYFNPRSAWLKLTKYKEIYGDLVFFHGLGNKILVLNTAKAIEDLLDKRGNIYSNRPTFTVVGELMALGQSMPLLPYGKEWREHRKLAHAGLSTTAVKKYHSMQEDLGALMNKAFLDHPEDFFAHVRLTAGRIILSLTYGLSVKDADDKYITHAEETMEMIGKATVPGAYLADLIPILKHLPSWVPFHREAVIGKEMIERLVTMPYEHVKREMNEGIAPPSLARDLLTLEHEKEETKAKAEFDHRVKWTTGALYGAGGETTYATVLTFMMLMALHPDIQTRAQAEVDSIVGRERTPVVSDKDDLPYVNAVIKEVMRYHPALPLSIARLTASDDCYEGYYIPKGTVVLPNVWAIAFSHNPIYPPHQFIPERYLPSCPPEHQGPEPSTWAFGFGRRICPGKAVAENSLFVLISGILSCFDILPPEDKDGGVEGLNVGFGPNLVSYPDKFKCRIIPRSEKVVRRIETRVRECRV